VTSALDGGERSASRPGRFTPVKEPPEPDWIGGWMGSTAGLDAVANRNKAHHCPCREMNPGLQPLAKRVPSKAAAVICLRWIHF